MLCRMETSKFVWMYVSLFQVLFIRGDVDQLYMDDHCGDQTSVPTGAVLHLTSSPLYDSNMDCKMELRSPLNTRLMVKFQMMDIEDSFHCHADNLQIYDGFTTNLDYSLTGSYGLCGEDAPSQTYLSTANELTFSFESEEFLEEDGFTAVITSYTDGVCLNETVLRCENGRCISRQLMCDTYNNCGDWTDEDHGCFFGLSVAATIGVVFGAICLLLCITGCVIFRTCKRDHSSAKTHRMSLGPPMGHEKPYSRHYPSVWSTSDDRPFNPDRGFTNPRYDAEPI